MVGPDGSILVFNGEIYDADTRRNRLRRQGWAFRSKSDTEVLLASLTISGVASILADLDGMFAFAWWSASSRSLVLARDHAGIKPLYFGRSRLGVVFGSQLDVVAAHPWFRDAPIDPEGLATFLRLGFTPEPLTVIRGIESLEPGTWLEFDQRLNERRGRYFCLSESAPADADLEELLDSAISSQMVADVPIGVLLSGGVDSPLVAGLAQRHASRPLDAFTIGRPDDHDESAEAARFAAEFGLHHDLHAIESDEVRALFAQVAAASSEPLGDYSILPTLAVCQRARRKVVVGLSGDGGDELFYGYAARFASVLSVAPWYSLPLGARRVASGGLRLIGSEGHRGSRSWPSIGDWYWAKHCHSDEGVLSDLFPDLPFPAATKARLFDFDGFGRDQTAEWLRWNEWTVHLRRVLRKVDIGSMFHSLEVRVPLLSRPLVRYAFGRPWRESLSLQTLTGKLPLRQQLARLSSHQHGGKRGFGIPVEQWLAGPLAAAVEQLFQDNPLADLGARPEAVTRSLRGPGWQTWIFIALALWWVKLKATRRAVLHSSPEL